MTNHGGSRQGAGRKPSPFISKLVTMHFKNEKEYQELINDIPDPRTRSIILLISKTISSIEKDNVTIGKINTYCPNCKESTPQYWLELSPGHHNFICDNCFTVWLVNIEFVNETPGHIFNQKEVSIYTDKS